MPKFIKKECIFCRKHIAIVDYKDVNLLQKLMTHYGRIEAARRTGTCHKHQRRVSTAIKQARHLALLPYTNR